MLSFLRASISAVGRTPITGMWNTQITLVPRALTQSFTRLFTPPITDEMVMTVLTPMTMPSTVRPERSLLVRRVSSAIFTDSRVCPLAIWRELLAACF